METRVAVMSIIVEDGSAVETINAVLHNYGEYIIGRMGLPYRQRNISIISIALDAPQNVISAIAGKIGGLNGVSVKTAYSSVGGVTLSVFARGFSSTPEPSSLGEGAFWPPGDSVIPVYGIYYIYLKGATHYEEVPVPDPGSCDAAVHRRVC